MGQTNWTEDKNNALQFQPIRILNITPFYLCLGGLLRMLFIINVYLSIHLKHFKCMGVMRQQLSKMYTTLFYMIAGTVHHQLLSTYMLMNKTQITAAIEKITPEMLARMWQEFDYRMNIVKMSEERVMLNIYRVMLCFKKNYHVSSLLQSVNCFCKLIFQKTFCEHTINFIQHMYQLLKD